MAYKKIVPNFLGHPVYVYCKFDVDSSSSFMFTAQTQIQTHTQSQILRITLLPALVFVTSVFAHFVVIDDHTSVSNVACVMCRLIGKKTRQTYFGYFIGL